MARGLAEQFRVFAEGTAEQVQRVLVDVAKREHAKIMAEEPRPSGFLRVVDGVRDAAEEAVKATGRITYHYSRLDGVVDYALQALILLSPKLSGAYARSHLVFLNGSPVAKVENIGPTDEITILNPLPYTRKIELGKMKMRVPGTDHVYERAERVVSQKFGRQVSVRFTFRSFMGGEIMPYQPGEFFRANRAKLKQQPARMSAMKMERASRVPALVIRGLF